MTVRELQELRRRLWNAYVEVDRRVSDRDDPPTVTRRQQLAAERSTRDARSDGRFGGRHR